LRTDFSTFRGIRPHDVTQSRQHELCQKLLKTLIIVLDGLTLAPSMTLTFISAVKVGNAAPNQRLDDFIRLIPRNDSIFFALKDGQRVLDSVGRENRRSFPVPHFVLRKRAHKRVQIMLLKLMSIGSQREKIRYPITANARSKESRMGDQAQQDRVPPCASAH